MNLPLLHFYHRFVRREQRMRRLLLQIAMLPQQVLLVLVTSFRLLSLLYRFGRFLQHQLPSAAMINAPSILQSVYQSLLEVFLVLNRRNLPTKIGRNVLEEDLEFGKQIADRCIDIAVARSKEVTVEQEQAKLAEEASRFEEEAAASAVLDEQIDDKSAAVADSILNLPVEDSGEASDSEESQKTDVGA